jgi:hypothetical protein
MNGERKLAWLSVVQHKACESTNKHARGQQHSQHLVCNVTPCMTHDEENYRKRGIITLICVGIILD